MAKENAILVVHGMGSHTPPSEVNGKQIRGSFGKTFIEACNLALRKYQAHNSDDIENHIDVYEFNYNDFFDKVRKKMADQSIDIGETYGIPITDKTFEYLIDFESNYNSNSFFHTHCLDVIFYSTILGGKVRVDAGKMIAGLVNDYGQSKVHIFAHSLGTSVVHDTLSLLYRKPQGSENNIPVLDITNNKLGSLWMVANVSRILHKVNKISDPLTSVVKPGDLGCVNVFNNVRHELDPFTWISRFSPRNNDQWTPQSIYNNFYSDTVTSLITNPDTHDVSQYIEDPLVSERIFSQLMEFCYTKHELQTIRDGYKQKTIQGAYDKLKSALSGSIPDEFQEWRDIIDTGTLFYNFIKTI